VDLLALGPLTNVAQALQADPALAEGLEMITVMGCAVRVPGNVGSSSDIDNDVAEWNIYVDPLAAAIVFRSGAPVTLVPLDATNHAPLTMDFYRRLRRDRTTSCAEFAYRVFARNEDWIRSGHYFFWDPLAAAVATEDGLAAYEELPLTVIEAEGPQSGRTAIHDEDDGGAPVRVAVSADQVRFETLFLDALNRRLP
jgi:pyrimidine-specific ribonucleoside hydrolase